MTAQSATAGWVRRCASSSAGATCRPYLGEISGFQTVHTNGVTNLDLDQLLDAVDNKDMLSPLGTLAKDRFVTGAHPSIFERLLGRFVVIQVTQHHARGAHDQFSRCVIGSNLLALGGHKAGLKARDQTTRGAEHDVIGMGRADNGTRFGET